MYPESRYYCGVIGCVMFSIFGWFKRNICIMMVGVNCILYHILFPTNTYICLYDIVYNFILYLHLLIRSYKKINSYIWYVIYTIFIKWIKRDSVTIKTEYKHILDVHFPGLLILMYLL
uniref:Uncharacterized protein n=1 Tax=Megaviridae environmental sample TaxID=1737588 RepID=A0A5J6VKV3_9VIRU|nr:MAG: hypothetical protein [Megaviridae environmental sample]